MTRCFIVLFALALAGFLGLHAESAWADFVTHQIVVGDANVLDAWPGPDGEIGTADDVVTSNSSPISASGSNSIGSYSYNAFDFGGGTPESTLLPNPMDAVTFLEGTVIVDTAVGVSGGGPLLTSWNIMGTEPFLGHGPYDTQILSVLGGTYNSTTGAFSLNLDFVTTLLAGTAEGINFSISGSAFFVDLTQPSPSSGNAYVDNVLIPQALGSGAGSLIYLRGTGVVPQSSPGTGGGFPTFPIEAALFAVPEPASALINFVALAVILGLVGLRRNRSLALARG